MRVAQGIGLRGAHAHRAIAQGVEVSGVQHHGLRCAVARDVFGHHAIACAREGDCDGRAAFSGDGDNARALGGFCRSGTVSNIAAQCQHGGQRGYRINNDGSGGRWQQRRQRVARCVHHCHAYRQRSQGHAVHISDAGGYGVNEGMAVAVADVVQRIHQCAVEIEGYLVCAAQPGERPVAGQYDLDFVASAQRG